MPDTTAWDEIVPEAITSCKICGIKIWKFWHASKKKVYPEMDTCGPCLFGINKKVTNRNVPTP